MALIAYDGFDHYNSTSDMLNRLGTLQWTGQADTTLVNPGRTGVGKYINIGYLGANNGSLTATLKNPVTQLTVGMGMMLSGGSYYVQFLDQLTGAVQCSFSINASNGQVGMTNSTGAVVATGLNCVPSFGWMFLEFQALIGNATVGSMAVNINGQLALSMSGINTQSSANASVSGMRIGAIGLFPSGPGIDDVYFADGTTGPGTYINNSFLGDVRCATQFPIGNNSVQWTPLANANWQEVSETNMDSDTSYNYTDVAGAQDSFNFSALDVDVNEVLGLQITLAIRKVDAGARTVAPVLVIAGTSYVGTAVSVDVSYLYITSLWPTNPATGVSWTAADVAGLAAGYVVVT